MYREKPRGKHDSSWVFFSGSEDRTYADDPSNFVICALTTVAEIDPDVAGYLDLPPHLVPSSVSGKTSHFGSRLVFALSQNKTHGQAVAGEESPQPHSTY